MTNNKLKIDKEKATNKNSCNKYHNGYAADRSRLLGPAKFTKTGVPNAFGT